MKILHLILIASISITVLLAQGCTKDKIVIPDVCNENEVVTYDDVREIIRTSCAASSACHNSSGIAPDYSSWNDEMAASLTFERFESEVLLKKTMPKPEWPQLDSLQFNKIKCWVKGGYLQ